MSTPFKGAIFDVDGVLVDSPHEAAWQEALQELMENDWKDVREETSWSPEAFTPQVYQQVMSGKPRNEGALAALEHFGVPDAERRAGEYGERKQRLIVVLIEQGRFNAYPDALRFCLAVRAAGIKTAAASSSKNAKLFLEKIPLDEFAEKEGLDYPFIEKGLNLSNFFDADISGRDFERGKPNPEIFLTAAEELGLDPGVCFVVEDAQSGIEAAKAGRMAGLGVARHDDDDLLAAADADIIVHSLDEVDLDALGEGRLSRRGG